MSNFRTSIGTKYYKFKMKACLQIGVNIL